MSNVKTSEEDDASNAQCTHGTMTTPPPNLKKGLEVFWPRVYLTSMVQGLHWGIIAELHTCLSSKIAYINFTEMDKGHYDLFSFVSSQRA